MSDKNYKCTIGECPFCLALWNTNHGWDCPLFVGFKDDSEIREIIELWQKIHEVEKVPI